VVYDCIDQKGNVKKYFLILQVHRHLRQRHHDRHRFGPQGVDRVASDEWRPLEFLLGFPWIRKSPRLDRDA
jgi:hypothetical protein